MRLVSRIALLLVAVILVSLSLAGCGGQPAPQPKANDPAKTETPKTEAPKPAGDGSLDRVKKAGKLVFATDDTYPPMEFHDEKTNELVGFDIDLAREVAKVIGVQAAFEPTKWDGLIPGLKGKKYDAIISSMNVTDERKKEVAFADYVKLDQVFVVRAGGKAITKMEQLAGLTVAVQTDTTSMEMAEKVKGAKVVKFDSFNDTFVELRNKKADVVVVDEPVGKYYAVRDPKTFMVSGEAAERMPVGIALRKEDKELHEAITKAIAELKKSGKFKEISMKWFGDDLTNK